LLVVFISGSSGAQLGQKLTAVGRWAVYKSTDAMTDEIRCLATYGDRSEVQLYKDVLYISLKGRGGVNGFRLRFDDGVATDMQLPSKTDKSLSVISIRGGQFRRLTESQRLRAQILTVIGGVVDEDLNLTGLRDAVHIMQAPECGNAQQRNPRADYRSTHDD